ncbi:MAG TPA: glycosyltransferase family 4 protein [Solirubrobacteraceae bacterium]|jgi:glycosyltransferase involved in cell wall biosynthesis
MRRLLLVSHYALPHVGGMEMVIDAEARELARRGWDVVHVASAPPNLPGGPADPRPDGYRVVRVGALNALEERLGVPYPVFAPALLPVLDREIARADVVHAHGFLYMSSVLALLLARHRRPGAVRVLTEHVGHVDYETRALDLAESAAIAGIGRLSTRAAEGLITMNPKVADALRGLAPGRPVELIANGVDTEAFRPAAPAARAALRVRLGWDERPRVLFVGRLVAKKGVDVALAAAAAAPDAFRLVVAGPGRLPGPAPANVDLLGAVAPERVAELMQAADAFLLPSRGEGFPVTAQEAMASGLPAVLADDPNYAAHVGGAGDGVRLVAPEGGAVAAALRELLADPDARSAAGARAAAHAQRAFSWGAAMDAHEALFARLSARRSAPTPPA